MRVKVYIEGVQFPEHLVDYITISYSFNGYASAELRIPGDAITASLLSGDELYEKFSSLLLLGYPDIKIIVDDEVLFEGLITGISFDRQPNDAGIHLTCESHFMLSRLFNLFVLQVSNFADRAQFYYNGGAIPIITPERGLGAVDQLYREFLQDLRELLQERLSGTEDPVQFLAERAFRLYERLDPNEFAVVEWARTYLELLPLYRYVRSYPPNSRHVFRFFLDSVLDVDTFFAVVGASILKESSSVINVFDFFLKILSTFQLYPVELPARDGLILAVKPTMMFHPPPKSNLIPSHMLISYSGFEETGTERPTRTYVRPRHIYQTLAESTDTLVGGLAILNSMVAAPEELERDVLIDFAEQLGLRIDPERPVEEIAAMIFDAVTSDSRAIKRYHAFLTEEERYRGIIPHYVDLPPGISDALVGTSFRNWHLLKELALNAHHSIRANYSRVSLSFIFNPYFLPGHTFMFTDGKFSYGGFATSVTHVISPQGMYTSVQGINFTRVDENTEFQEFVSVFEMVEDGDRFHTMTEEDVSDYYRTMYGTDMGTYDDLMTVESYGTVTEESERQIRTYRFWRRPLSNEGRPFKQEDRIREMVEQFLLAFRRATPT